ncbi:MAG: sulfatase-like hydrolase/transferase [Acidobacteria bacterium]|nr:sulfatase-like hydrolase/transferase [Acidobacteriota bacterium]
MKTQRRQFLQVLSTGAAGALSPALKGRAEGAQPQQERPNILIIMADQHRAGLTRRSGFPLDTMPALDGLASRGVAFDRAYTTSPLCVPARISLLTGRWPHAHRVRQNSAPRFAVFEKDLFDVARELGYKTALTGKNHSHLTPAKADFWRPYMHTEGWLPDPPPKEFVAYDDWIKHLNPGMSLQATPFPVETQFPHRIVSNAIEFIQGAGTQPFALWVSFPEPHNPYQVPKPYFDMFPPDSVPPRAVGPEVLKSKGFKWEWLRQLEASTFPGYDENWRRTRSNYLGMLRLINDQVDRLLHHLETSGKLENTIVVYVADHGDFFCDYGLMRKGVELPEVLTRIPMVWAGWGVRPQSKLPAFVSLADVLPTLCDAVGAPVPHGAQGRSLWPMLQGRDYPREEFETLYSEVGFGGMNYGPGDDIDPKWGRSLRFGTIPACDELNPVTQSGDMKMVRRGDWKLIFDMMGNGQLYNLAEDPYELKNLFGQPHAAATQNQLTADLLRWTIRTQDDLPLAAYKTKWPVRNWYAKYKK